MTAAERDARAVPTRKQWVLDVDRATCTGTGMCVGSAPEHFRLEGGRARVIDGRVAPDEMLIDAADVCPVEAITVRDAVTGEVLAPEA